MKTRRNRRGFLEHFVSNQHLKLKDLKLEAEASGLENRYLCKENIPEYPKPEFQVSLLKHDTTGSGLCGIRKDGGFKDPYGGSLIWWSLSVGPEEMKDAELRLLEKTFPGVEVEAAEQQNFLWRFATSPAFLETSRLGSYRFTFPLEEVLMAYRDQFCSGLQPIMRIYETVLYKQEVMHVVLVHSPANQNFSHHPLLTDDPDAICVFKDGRFIWRPEAMCETHWCELICRHDSKQLEACGVAEDLHYVWDHVAVALHVGKTQVLRFNADRLRNNLKFCCQDDVTYTPLKEVEFDDAKAVVRRLWSDWRGPLERTSSLLHRLTGGTRCCLQRATIFSREVTIIDTPGLSAPPDPEVRKEIFRCINLSAPAAHAVLLVLRLDFTTRAEETVKLMEEMFGRNVWSRTLVLFTHQDRAEPDIQNQLQRNGAQMKTLLCKVGNRFQVLKNKVDHRDVQQVWDLLFQVREMLVNNNRW